MGTLRPRDLALVAALLLLWAPSFALFVRERAAGRPAWIPVQVRAASDALGYPRFVDTWAWSEQQETGLAPGDELMRVGGSNLQGAGAVAFFAHALANADGNARVPVLARRGERTFAVTLELRRERYPRRDALVILSFFGMALFAFLRVPRSRLARTFLLASTAYTLTWTSFQGGPALQNFAYVALRTVSGALAPPLMLLTALSFPEVGAARRSATPRWPWLFAIVALSWTSLWFGFPLDQAIGARLNLALGFALSVTLLALLARSYRRAGPAGRRQIKWVVYGNFLGLVPVLVALALAIARPEWWWLWDPSAVSLVLIPLFILIAIVRSNLLDIDRLIGLTTSITILLGFLVGGAAFITARFAAPLANQVGVDPASAQLGLIVSFALLGIPAERFLRPRVEALIFVERRRFESRIDRLLDALETCESPTALAERAGTELSELLNPECCVIYGQSGDVYAPIFERGRALPSGVPVSCELVRALADHAGAVDAEEWARRRSGLPPRDHALLQAIGASVLLPVRRSGNLVAFVCLGRKRSGDIYTATERALLAAVAEKLSSELMRFDAAELIRQTRAMHDALRRYVPSGVAERLASGESLEPERREVSVLFVDLRGYSRFSEARDPAEIFSTVNRYTQLVSHIVRAHGGAVAEFHGDGMMAVFGAPETLAAKEAAALDAAIEIGQRLEEAGLGGQGSEHLTAGIGIASGEAFVGCLRAADRLVWSAIGRTTNLAARLQELTRTLDASIVIDEATHRALPDPPPELEPHRGQWIRGLSRPEDIYALPLGVASDARAAVA
ncbi:MAG TPA: adenylate/guanylate cyclase domain-containing protein [Myxococcota bacterium]